jgi:hypothetical protein
MNKYTIRIIYVVRRLPDRAPSERVLEMHEVRNHALVIENPMAGSLKSRTSCKKGNLSQGSSIFPAARDIVEDWRAFLPEQPSA